MYLLIKIIDNALPIDCENTFIDNKIQFQIFDFLLLQNLRKQRQIR